MSKNEIYICRFCLCQCENAISMLLDKDFIHKVTDVFYKLNFEISPENGLPVVVCFFCFNTITQFHMFFNSVVENQEKLACELDELLKEEVQEEVCEEEWQVVSDFEEAPVNEIGNYIEIEANEACVTEKRELTTKRRERLILSDQMVQRYKEGAPLDPDLKAKLDKKYKKLYICDYCENYHTVSRPRMVRHVSECKDNAWISSPEADSFRTVPRKEMLTIPCPICPPDALKMKNEQVLRLHLQEHADVERVEKDRLGRGCAPLIPCPKCERRLRSELEFQSHIKKHANDELMTCELCGRTTVKSNLRSHLRNHFKRIVCEFCSKVFKNHCNLEKHIAAKHRGPELFECIRCNTKIRREFKFKEHLAVCRGPGTVGLTCIHCGEVFESNSHRHYHVKKFHIGYKCKMCGIEVKSVTQLKHHYKSDAHKQRSQEKKVEAAQSKLMKMTNQSPQISSIVLKRR